MAHVDQDKDKAKAVAGRFAALLRKEIGAKRFAEVRRRNVAIGPGACASHDFLDANMVMDAAFRSLGIPIWTAPEDDDDCTMRDDALDLWNTAWTIAKRDHLTDRRALRRARKHRGAVRSTAARRDTAFECFRYATDCYRLALRPANATSKAFEADACRAFIIAARLYRLSGIDYPRLP